MSSLFAKYDIPAPRYTSYPTVPYWQRRPDPDEWLNSIRAALTPETTSWSMYIHVPFCETLCTFCGCNNVISKNHKTEEPYIQSVQKEWGTYLRQIPEFKNRPLRQIHLGGGSPTFLSPENLEKLLRPFWEQGLQMDPHFEASIEVDPRRTTLEQLKLLRRLGFNRISLGVQDFDPEVQRLVNRIQPYDVTERIVTASRDLGYQSVNLDLIYGLAKQNLESMKKSAELTLQLRPDRIALYSFALVPWIKPQQRLFKDEDLPRPELKRALYELAREILLNAGYLEVGMDHFALPTDALALAMKNKTLHRNFMGYTDMKTDVLLGLGVSSISETPDCFHQNEKVLPVYQTAVGEDKIPSFRGHVLSSSDKIHRQQILEFMTQSQVTFQNETQWKDAQSFLAPMLEDGLVEILDVGDSQKRLRLTEKGRPFMRNACMFFDEHLRKNKPDAQTFSKSI